MIELADVLKELSDNNNGVVTGSNTEIRLKCPKCLHANKKLYVGIMAGSDLLGYNCKHCDFSGIVGPKFLKEFNCREELVRQMGNKRNIHNSKITNPITKINKIRMEYPNNAIIRDMMDKHPHKVKYLESTHRFNRKLTVEDVRKYKIILDLRMMLKYNNINPFKNDVDNSKRKFMIDELSKDFVGFFTFDNNKCNMRNVSSKIISDKYINFIVDRSINNPFLYMPENNIDFMTKSPTIVLCEGPFDLFGIIERYYLNEDFDTVFSACGNCGAFKRALYQIMKMTGFVNASIIIYSDNDVSLEYYKKKLKDEIGILDFTIIYNKLGKDFGDMGAEVKVEKILL